MVQSEGQREELTVRIARLEAAIEALMLKVDKQVKRNEGMDRHNDRTHIRSVGLWIVRNK
jgi:hypothetical protein